MTIGQALEKVLLVERQPKQLKEAHGLTLSNLDLTDKDTITINAYGLMGAMAPKDIMNHFAFHPQANIPDESASEFGNAVLGSNSEKAVQILCETVGEIKPESRMPFYDIEF